MRNLEALNILTLRPQDRGGNLHRECRKFIIDVMHFCPQLKLKYVGMSSTVYQFSAKPKMSLPEWLLKQDEHLTSRSGKGKGKAKAQAESGLFDGTAEGSESESLSDLEDERPNVYVAKHWRYSDVPEQYAIFSNEVRKAKL